MTVTIPDIEVAWQAYWKSTESCPISEATSAYDTERTGFFVGYRAALEAQAWRPIEDAPSARTLVDLWLVGATYAWRQPDARWDAEINDWTWAKGRLGQYLAPPRATHFRHHPSPPEEA